MNSITYDDFCRTLQLDPNTESLEATIQEFTVSAATFYGVPHFMRPDYYHRYLPMIGSDTEELLPLMDQIYNIIIKNEALQLYAWHAYNMLFVYRSNFYLFTNWPQPVALLGKLAGMFDLMLSLGSIELFQESYRKLGLPESYAADTAKWLGGTVLLHRAGHDNVPGICRSQMFWLTNYTANKLFRIGRLEFMTQPWHSEAPVLFRHRQTREVVALCNDKWALNEKGLRVPYEEAPETAAYITQYQNDGQTARGTLIHPAGHALIEREEELDLNLYRPLLAKHDIIPGVHIPAGGNMTPEAVKESFRQATEFYKRYLNLSVKGFCCHSWIFNTAFERELPESNLANLMRQVYLFPCPGSGKDGLFFAFGRADGEFSDYPRDTSLRRAFHRIVESGESLRSGGMILLTDDLDQFGTEFYRRMFNMYHKDQQ